jgi:mono/diheme cytochrome c family protein
MMKITPRGGCSEVAPVSERPPGARRRVAIFAALVCAIGLVRGADMVQPAPDEPKNPLVWDAMEKTVQAKSGDGAAEVTYYVRNTGPQPIEIIQVRPSCGCTMAETPPSPWILKPGAKSSFTATIDLRAKSGELAKTIFVNSTAGTQMLTLRVKIPEMSPEQREHNRAIATADRQAVFRGDCAACHSQPLGQRTGAELFQSACGICHFASPRATMVADLLTARDHRDAAFWRRWISEGKDGTLMPAFAQSRGGPLTEAQIESLVEYALANLPTEPRPKSP